MLSVQFSVLSLIYLKGKDSFTNCGNALTYLNILFSNLVS